MNLKFKILTLLIFLNGLVLSCFATPNTLSVGNNTYETDSAKVDELLNLCIQFEYENPEKAYQYVQSAYNLALQIEYQNGIGMSILYEGFLHEDSGNYKAAMINYKSAIRVFEKENYKKGIAKANNALGLIYQNQGQYIDALERFQISHDIYVEIDHPKGIAISLGNMGMVQKDNKNYTQAMDYYSKAIAIKKDLKDTLGISIDEMNIGNVYYDTKDYNNSLKHYNESLKLSKLINDNIGVAYCYTNIGNIYFELKEIDKAIEYFQKAIPIQEKLGDIKGLAHSFKCLGISYIEKEDYNKATSYLMKGLNKAKQINLLPVLNEIYQSLSSVSSLKKDYQSAFIYQSFQIEIKDSIYNIEKTKQLSKLEAIFQNKEKTKQLKNKEKALISSQKIISDDKILLEKEHFQKQLFLWGLSFTLCVGVFGLYMLFKKKRLADELEKLSIVAREIENTVIIADKHGEIEWLNESYTRKAGFNLHEFKEKFGKYIVNASDTPHMHEIIAQCKLDKKPVKYSMHMEKKSGEMHWIQTTLTPVLDKKNEIHKFVLIDSDITDIKNAEKEIEIQRDELRYKNNQITESIDYAKKIQFAFLPLNQKINTVFKESFVFYSPKDIVSGDFYWLRTVGDEIIFASADCTGHGVPGALMSLIGVNSLNKIIDNNIFETNDILYELGQELRNIFQRDNKNIDQIKDAMDIALCKFTPHNDKKTLGTLQYSGAHNSLYIIRNKELIEYKANRVHLGSPDTNKDTFTKTNIPIFKNDIIYTFSDGFVDQKGGPNGKKFFYGPFRDLLIEIHLKPMDEQKSILLDKISGWKGDSEQLDDMLIWGIRF